MRVHTLLIGCLAMLLTAAPALAQEVGRAPDRGVWIAIVIGIVNVLVIAVVSFLGSKRTHQD